jgi:hypothetical protein
VGMLVISLLLNSDSSVRTVPQRVKKLYPV